MHVLMGERWGSEAAAWQKYPHVADGGTPAWAFAKTGHDTKDKQPTEQLCLGLECAHPGEI